MSHSCPMSAKETIDRYFLKNRAALLEIAAFLDRIDRSESSEEGAYDFRLIAFKKALRSLVFADKNRTKNIHLALSDPTESPRESAAGLKGANGAWNGDADGNY